jgi:two-component system, chemotaxis family, protein-glutamate methylesterase/glutaminase
MPTEENQSTRPAKTSDAHRIVVIGASAGGVEALQQLAHALPANLPAPVFVVLHVHARSKSVLPEILSSAGPLPAVHAVDGARIEDARIYIAPPDHHLIIEREHMHVGVGPKENYQRPSINVTFRSAALAYGDRTIGVVLTGQLDDGTAGSWDIKRRGGTVIVQHPEDAAFSSMPLSTLREVEADYTVPLAEIGPLLGRLLKENGSGDISVQRENPGMQPRVVDLTCPECRGTIWEVQNGPLMQYRCRVGHSFSPRSMLAEHTAAQEKALWAAIVALEEGAVLANKLAHQLEPQLRDQLLQESRQKQQQAAIIRTLIQEQPVFSLD